MIDLTALTETGLNANNAIELRKAAAELGIKGANKGRKADLIAQIMILVEAAKTEQDKVAKPARKSSKCTDCGFRKQDKSIIGPELCEVCYGYAGWENEHADGGHEGDEQCPVCHPELDLRYVRNGRSRAGMVIVAKGTEVHKSDTFRRAAEALGWSVEIEYTEMDEADENEEPLIRHHAVATKNGVVVEGSWIGKAWDYANAGAGIGGKARKVRNLKEALRILAAN